MKNSIPNAAKISPTDFVIFGGGNLVRTFSRRREIDFRNPPKQKTGIKKLNKK